MGGNTLLIPRQGRDEPSQNPEDPTGVPPERKGFRGRPRGEGWPSAVSSHEPSSLCCSLGGRGDSEVH